VSTTKDTERVLTIPVTQPNARVALRDRLYASINMSTDSPPSQTHWLSIKIGSDGEVNLHFDGVYICMSQDDWFRVTEGVNDALASVSA
jgi:hypothetical protein